MGRANAGRKPPSSDSLTLVSGGVQDVAIDDLRFDLSPRRQVRDREHAAALAEILPRLPPVLVHAQTKQVIDGVHRVLAARMRGEATIRAQLFHGSEADAMVAAVHRNVAHGKPLTLAERSAAALRILRMHFDWSDRRVADLCGVSAKTVGRLRPRAAERSTEPKARVGRDGKARPTDPIELRHRIAEALETDPDASVPELARRTGASLGTVRDVRRRVQHGQDVLSPRLAQAYRRRQERERKQGAESEDESYRSSEEGVEFTYWFGAHCVRDDSEWERFVDAIPMSRIYEVADEARKCRDSWQRFVTALEGRARRRSG